MTTRCPHCSGSNADGAAFCVSCGKALPSAASGGPRIVSKSEIASSAAGQGLQSEELRKKMRTAFTTLLVLAILQGLVGGLLLALSQSEGGRDVQDKTGVDLTVVGAVVLVIGVIFLGLALWARKAPFPAALTGLVLVVSLWTIDIVVAIADGQPQLAVQGWLIKFIVIAALCRAVGAGIKYRALKRSMAHGAP